MENFLQNMDMEADVENSMNYLEVDIGEHVA
jgi:hypothetical protein